MSKLIRVLIVDDSAFMRLAVERMLSELEEIEIVGTAANGLEAVREAKEKKPDVIILDVNMPEMDGIEALRHIMAESPTKVLMLSTLTREGAQTTMEALELGAVDFLDKATAGTAMDIYTIGPHLREKVLTVAGATVREPVGAPVRDRTVKAPSRPAASVHFEVLVIGASTGGPRALSEVLGRLPSDFPLGAVIAQHMPPGFTSTLAQRLNRRCVHEVLEAESGMRVEPGKVLFAPGGHQTILRRNQGALIVDIDRGPADLLYRPSVNLLFESAARNVGNRAIGVILTGMGDDGADGLRALRDAGAPTMVESQDTAVIYGMPRVAAESADRILPLREIGPAIRHLCENGGWEGFA